MSVHEPWILPWSPAGLANSVNHTGGLGIDMTLIKLGGRENQDRPAMWLSSHYVICLLSGVHWGANLLQLFSPLAWPICPACPQLTLGQQIRWWGEGREQGESTATEPITPLMLASSLASSRHRVAGLLAFIFHFLWPGWYCCLT